MGYELETTSASARVGSSTEKPNDGRNGFRHRQPPPRVPVPREEEDDVLDVGKSLLSAKNPAELHTSMVSLLAEMERLREEVDVLRHHSEWIAEQADLHPILPVFHRRSFLRELETLLTKHVSGVLILMHISGIDPLREENGIAAADAVLHFIMEILGDSLDQGDLCGYLDGGDFAFVSLLTQEDKIRDKIRSVVSWIEKKPFDWGGHLYPLAARVGMVSFGQEGDADRLLAAADRALLISPV